MEPVRSALFIPGNKPGWISDAPSNDADVVILDLEDAVPPAETADARVTVADAVPDLRAADQRAFVRVNGHPNADGDIFSADAERVVPAAPEAVLVPKLREPRDVERVDAVFSHVERREGMEPGTIELVVVIETIEAMRNVYDLCAASDRVASITCGAPKGTDTARALRFDWSGPGRRGLETLHMRQKSLLDARAAGVQYPLAGPFVDIDDTGGLLEDVRFAREMGYEGYLAIHPSQVPPVNEAFTPDESDVEYWLGLYETLEAAIEEGNSTVRYQGEMVDTANLKTAEEFLRHAKAFEDDLDIDVES